MNIALLIAGMLLAVGVLLRWRHHSRHLAGEREEAIHSITQQLPITAPLFRRYPVLGVDGRYGAHPIAIDSFPRKTKRGIRSCFRIHMEVGTGFRGRFYIQSALRHGKVTHLYGMGIVLTDDPNFDREFIVMAGAPEAITPLLTADLRSRLCSLRDIDFAADFSQDAVLIEIVQADLKPAQIVEIIRTLTELSHLILIKA